MGRRQQRLISRLSLMAGTIGIGAVSFGQSNRAELIDRIVNRADAELVRQLGESGDGQNLSILVEARAKSRNISAGIFQMALARLGEPGAILEISRDAYDTDPYKSVRAVEKLEQLKGAWALRILFTLLANGAIPDADHDVFFDSPSQVAHSSLRRIVPDPPREDLYGKERLTAWEEYFRLHPRLIEIRTDWAAIFTSLADAGKVDEILAAGRLAPPSSLGPVKSLLSGSQRRSRLGTSLRAVAARLGDTESFETMHRELTSGDLALAQNAILGFAYVGGNRALDELWNFTKVLRVQDPLLLSALLAMRTIVPNPPRWRPMDSAADATRAWESWYRNGR